VPVANQTSYTVVIATVEGVTGWNIWLPLLLGADLQDGAIGNETNHAGSHSCAWFLFNGEDTRALRI